MKVKLKFKTPNDFYQLTRKLGLDGSTEITFTVVEGIEIIS